MIEELLTRGVEAIYPNKAILEKKIAEGKPLTLYLGIDPTGPTLHLGHAIILQKLKKFQEMGHKIVLLIGDFTAMIGDPDKLSVRVPLSAKQIRENASLYKDQASIFLKFSGRNKAEIKYNSKWLSKMKFEDVLELLSKVTVDQLLKRDMFQKRIAEGRPIYLHEFMYPVMQGYDSVVLEVDGEIGGNDQTFNMLVGRDLMKELRSKEKFVIAMKLLTDPNGSKMGKTEGNMITLVDSADQMFGKVMSWTDSMIPGGFETCTEVSLEEINGIKAKISSGGNPRDAKLRLAREIATIYHGHEEAERAEKNFIGTFQKGGIPENMEVMKTSTGTMLIDLLLEKKLVASKTEWRRLLDEGAISVAENGEKITDPFFKIHKDQSFKVGKRRFIKVKVEK